MCGVRVANGPSGVCAPGPAFGDTPNGAHGRACRAGLLAAAVGRHSRPVTDRYTCRVARSSIYLSLDEAMALCLILAEAADAISAEEELRDTWVEEAR